MSTPNRFLVKADSVAAYFPANHTGTVNRRLIGPETVGAQQLEVVLGITVTSEEPAKVLVIYAPPYGESPLKATRHR